MSSRYPNLGSWGSEQLGPLSEPPYDIDSMPHQEAIESIRGWFFQNFEDPAESTLYESAEGGYIFIWGGPYSAQEIIEDVFFGIVSEDVIKDVVKSLAIEAFDWAPSSGRIIYKDQEITRTYSDAISLYAEMQLRITGLEDALAQLTSSPGIGHNNPPGSIDATSLSSQEVAELRDLLGTLKRQPATPVDNGAEAKAIAEKLKEKGKILGDIASTELTKETVKKAFSSVATFIAGVVLPKIVDLVGKILEWISSLIY